MSLDLLQVRIRLLGIASGMLDFNRALDDCYLADDQMAELSHKVSFARIAIYSLDQIKSDGVPGSTPALVAGLAISWLRLRTGLTTPISICLVRNDVPNAVAVPLSDGSFCIVMSDMIEATLVRFACCLLSTQPVADIFAFPPQAVKITADNFRTLERTKDGFPRFNVNTTLRSVAVVMASLSAAFVAFHELGHIMRGHLGLINKGHVAIDDTVRVLPENDLTEYVSGSRLRQALEVDADDFAIRHFLAFASETQLDKLQIFGEGDLTVASTASVAAQLFFMAVDFKHEYDPGWLAKLQCHPPRDFRTKVVANALEELLLSVPLPVTAEKAKERMGEVRVAIMLGQSFVDGTVLKRVGQNSALRLENAYARVLANELDKIRAELDALKPEPHLEL